MTNTDMGTKPIMNMKSTYFLLGMFYVKLLRTSLYPLKNDFNAIFFHLHFSILKNPVCNTMI